MRPSHGTFVGCTCLGALFLTVSPLHGGQLAAREHLPNLDQRQDRAAESAAVPPDKAAALHNLRAQAPDVRVDFDHVTGAPKWIGSTRGFLTGRQGKGLSPGALGAGRADDPHRLVKAFVRQHRALFGHGPEALEAARVTRDYTTPHNGMKTAVWEQQLDGIPVFDAKLVSHTTRDGEIINVSSRFVPDLAAAAEAGTPGRAAKEKSPAIPARRAVVLAAGSLDETLAEADVSQKSAAAGEESRQQFRAPGLKGDVNAALTWLPLNGTNLRLCWDVTLTSGTRGEMYRVLVDAQSGEVLLRRCLTAYLSDATYGVFTSDSPSPFSPGNPTPVTNQPPYVARTLVTLPALNTNASPLGWINDGGNETWGNNVDAHTDRNADDSPDLPRPQGSPARVFDFSLDLDTQDPTNYSAAAVVQLFYLCNVYHDKLYELGFTEAAGNFQSNNFARGGLGNDAVQADAQDGSGTDNANFSTPPDGFAGRMQMYIFTKMTPRRDGDLDAEIVFHEYTHGLSWRLVGGGQGLGTTQSDGMGEGWSDFYALALLSEPGDDVNGVYAAGGYASYKIGGASDTQNYYFGIRRYPYTTDMSKNPLTFNDIDPAQADNCASPAPYHTAMFGSCSGVLASEVHNEGEVWCVTLWDARANLINQYGWTNGNQLMLQLVTDGMKLTPASPNFLQARDAILQADLVDTGGANRAELWAAFAKRGMGFSATSPSGSTAAGVHEAFDVPDDLRVSPGAGFISAGPVGGPFAPGSMTFTLTNAGSNSLSWSAGNTSAWLTVTPAAGTVAPNGAANTITATVAAAASTLPPGVYPDTIWFTNLDSGNAQSRACSLRIGQVDYFTELFSSSDNDLDYNTFTFTPNGSASFYSACRETAASFPTDPSGGTALTLSDDSFIQVALSGTNTVAVYNRRTNVFFVGSNGYLTLGSGDNALGGSFANHFNRSRVSACFMDLYPPAGGSVSWKETAELVAVTFQNVRDYGSAATVSFQIELFYDGRIRLTYLAVGITGGLAGLSAGNGVPPDFLESDLTSYGPCLPPDDLVVLPTGGFTSQGYEGGPFVPAATVYTLGNSGTNPVAWSATANQPWLTLSATNGTLDPSANTNVSIDLNAQAGALTPGSYNATVTYSNLASGFPQTRSVALTVLAIPGEIAVLDSIPPAADLQMPFGDVIVGAPRTEQVTLTNTDANYGLVVTNISFGSYSEDFDDGLAQDWVETTDAYWSVVSGEYRAQVGITDISLQSIYTGSRWQNCAAQMVVRRTGNAGSMAGVAVRASDDFSYASETGSAYCVGISGNGSYWVGKFVSGAFTFLQPWTASPFLNTGTAANTVAVSVNGSTLRAYLNGALAWSGTDTSIGGQGRVGLIAYSGSDSETIHYFDNVVVADPVSGIAAVDAEQQSYNARPLEGGSANAAPVSAQPAPARRQTALNSGIRIQSLVSGPFRLENVPTLPLTIPPHSAVTFEVVCQPTQPGSNYTRLIIDNNDADESHVEMPVTAQGILDYLQVSPASGFVSEGHPGGPFTPSNAGYVLSNAGPIAIDWAASHTQAWVSASVAGGTLLPGAWTNVVVGFTAAADSLPIGAHHDTLIFTNLSTTLWQQRSVALTVYTSPQIVVAPPSIDVTNTVGGSTNVTLTVSNALSADANLTFTISTAETSRDVLALAAAGVGLPPAGRDFTQPAPNQKYREDLLLVRFAAGVQGAQRLQLLNALGGAVIAREYKLVPGLCLVNLPTGQALTQALQTLNGAPGILYAEPDYQVHAVATFPNDARFSELWGLHNTGQTGGTADADIDAPEAWDLTTGNRQVIVAVIDTGVDYTHPDLTNNIWVNPGEIPGNGIDDDGNGYIDDVHGYDFVNNDGNPIDDHFHGTHCSGTIGAEGNNGIGVAGVCWKVRIMGVKFLDASGNGDTANAISSVQYAVQMGARVMNNSWGGGAYSQGLKDAIDAAGAAGCVFTAAAGNDYGNNNDVNPVYPASYSSANIIAVMSTDHNDVRSDFSNYGLTNVDLAGPGTSILSCQPGGVYQKLNGTSMATPHVSGACALLLSANPMLSVAQLKQTLLSTVDPVLPGQCVSGGRLNLARALASVGTPWITVTPAGGTNVPPGSAIDVTVSFLADELAPGAYFGQLVITCNDHITPSVTVPVSMTILPEDLQVTPASVFASSGALGGPFVPSEMIYTLTNSGASSLNWAIAHTQSWVSLSSAGGALPAYSSLLVTGAINSAAAALPPGVYADTLTFSNLTSGGLRQRVVNLSVVNPMLTIADTSVVEGDAGSADAVFNVTLQPPTLQTVTVAFSTSNGTAVAGFDYVATNGILSFAPGQTNGSITVTVLGDTELEGNETFSVVLSNAVAAEINRAVAIGTILDDEAPPYVYLRSAVGSPWGSTANETAMSRVFGTNNWQDLRFETANPAVVFNAANRFIFMDGSDYGALEMQAFLTANLTTMLSWVADGGRLFLNAAPNEGSSMSLGFGVTLTYPDTTASAAAVSPLHPICQGPFLPVGTTWTGSSFGHATVSGSNLSPIITNTSGGHIVLGEIPYGSGLALFGGMTVSDYHLPLIEAANLRANILDYTAHFLSDALRVTPSTGLISSGSQGGPFAPSNAVYTVQNNATSNLNWSATCTQSWVTISPSDGWLPPGASTNLTVSIDAASLTVGTYNGVVIFSNILSGASQSRAVQLMVVQPSLTVSDASVREGDSGITNLSFQVSLLPPSAQTVMVDFATSDGSASAGSDYAATNGTLTFLPYETNRLITVLVNGDTNNEPSETLIVTLSNPVNASLGDSLAVGTIINDDGCVAESNYVASITFTDALSYTTMTMAFDGTNYWSTSGGDSSGNRLARYDAAGNLVSRYAPGLDFRSVFTDSGGALYARAYASRVIYRQSAPGSFAPYVTLTGGSLDDQSSVVFNGSGTEFIAVSGGLVSRWQLTGAYLGNVTLVGFGAVSGENSIPQSRGIAAAGDYWLTYNGSGILSAWDETGARITQATLQGAGISTESAYSFGYCGGRVFLVDTPGGIWRGYDFCGQALPVAPVLHHFAWAPIESVQYVDSPFPVSLTAIDQFGSPVTNFAGTPLLIGWSPLTNTIFSANFDTGPDGFTYTPDPDATSNLWHVTSHRSGSSPNCQYYGQETVWTYDTGARNAGNLDSPVISLAQAAAPITLSFRYILQTEGGTGWDQATVLVSTNAGASWTVLASRESVTNALVQSAVFTNWSGDLSACAGRDILLRFNFDTIDPISNGFEGWYLDDVLITSSAVPVAIQPLSAGPFTNGTWSGLAVVLEPAADVYLRADDGSGHTGASNPFSVLPRPGLAWNYQPALGVLEFAWAGAGFHLQAQTNGPGVGISTNWFDYPGGDVPPVIIPISPTNSGVFFRLARP